MPGTASVLGDRSEPDGLAGLDGRRFDAVVDLSAYESEWTRRAIEAFGGRVGHYVFISSGTVYRASAELPWPETAAVDPQPHWGGYAREKAASEAALLDAHRSGRLSVTVLRLPYVLGPGNYADREAFVVSRLEARRPILLPGGGGAVSHFVFFADVAEAVVACLADPDRSAGEAFNVGFRRGLTNRGFVELVADVHGSSPDIVDVDLAALGLDDGVIDLGNVVFPFPNHHFLLDTTKIRDVLGFEARTDHARMIGAFCDWWPSAPDRTPRRYDAEDRAAASLATN